MNDKLLAIFVRHVGKQSYFLYLYDYLELNKYLGYIDLLKFIKFEPHDSVELLKNGFAIDFALLQGATSTIAICCLDAIFIIGWDSQEWQQLAVIKEISGLDIRNITSMNLQFFSNGNIMMVYNGQWPF